jgi:hypothetical protein
MGHDGGVNALGGQGDFNHQVGLREPVAVEVAAVDHARNAAAVRRVRDLQVFYGCFQDQPVHGVALGPGLGSDIVCRERNGVALPFGGKSLAVRRKLAANAVGVGEEECRAHAIRQVAVWACPFH